MVFQNLNLDIVISIGQLKQSQQKTSKTITPTTGTSTHRDSHDNSKSYPK